MNQEKQTVVKPVVHYDHKQPHSVNVGGVAVLVPIDHPSPLVSNIKTVRTSRVLNYDDRTGEIETLNTVYRPALS